MRWLVVAFVALWVSFLLHPELSSAQGIATPRNDLKVDENTFREVAGDLRCPTCTGLSVLDSDASFSVQIKNEVKEQLASGKSKDEILKFFTERYGPWILRAPPKDGVHLFAWIIPAAVLIFGPILIWLAVWSRRDEARREELVTKSLDDVIADMQKKLAALRASGEGKRS